MTDGPFVVVARVVKTHGLRGEVSVAPAAEAPLVSLLGRDVWFVPPTTVRESRITAVRPGPKGPIVSFSGVDSIESARELAGTDILVAQDSLPDGWLETGGEDDLTGFMVTDVTHGELGEIVETLVTGANDVWVVQGDRYREVLVPVVDHMIVDLDASTRSITVDLPDGLIPAERV